MARRVISISDENYEALRRLGYAGDSMNDMIGKLLQITEGKVERD